MASFNTIADIKDAAQMLDTAVVQWMNAGPPDSIQNTLTEARELIQRGVELADAPLRIAVVGEFNSGKTLLLNALLDTTDLFPCLLQPTTGNVLEVRVNLRTQEKPPKIEKSTVSFFNQYEIDNILDYYLKDLKNQGLEGLPSKVKVHELEKFERLLCKKFQEIRALTPKYSILSALEYILALRYNQELVCREERHECALPVDLIADALTLAGRPDLNKGIQAIYKEMKGVYERNKSQGLVDKVTKANMRSIFPMMRRVMVGVSAWNVPFGVKDIESCSTLAFLDFPGLGAESSNARDKFLCTSEIRDAHAVLVMFNGSNPGTSGASVMATLFQKLGKLTSDRTIVAVNRFDEFHPLPAGRTVQTYYSNNEQGTTVGFCNVLLPAKNMMMGVKGFNMYICSALCYLFDEKARRPNWNFGDAQWFNDNKRQGAYTLYKRSSENFQKLIGQIKQGKGVTNDHRVMSQGLERYLHAGGVPALRGDLVKFAMEKGERLIREDCLKEIRNAYRMLDEVAPDLVAEGDRGPINPEVSFAAQEFYRVLELAVADTLPSGPSEYKKLKVDTKKEDNHTLWETMEQEIAASVTSWPEWFAILNQGMTGKKPKPSDKPQKRFGRYAKLKKQGGTVPTEFSAFDERFRTTAAALTQQTLECVGSSILYSIQRFENHPDYRDAIQHLQGMMMTDKLSSMEEALPLLDIWQPSSLGEEEIVPTVLERINDEVDAIETLSYPYDGTKPCHWNLALIIRVQVQLMKTYRDKLSRLVAAAENQFQSFFCGEVLRAEILPLVRSALNDADFLGEVALGEAGASWESVGQVVRVAVENIKAQDGVPGATPVEYKPKTPRELDVPSQDDSEEEADDFEDDTSDEDVAFEDDTPDVPEDDTPPEPEEEEEDDEEFEEW